VRGEHTDGRLEPGGDQLAGRRVSGDGPGRQPGQHVRDGRGDLAVLGLHPVDQPVLQADPGAQHGPQQLVLAGVVGVQEVQHLAGVRGDLGRPGGRVRAADQGGQAADLAPDHAMDEQHVAGVDTRACGSGHDWFPDLVS
jgi:hypothetical protein